MSAKESHNLRRLIRKSRVRISWVPSHAENNWNVYIDQLVRYGRSHAANGESREVILLNAATILKNLAVNRNRLEKATSKKAD